MRRTSTIAIALSAATLASPALAEPPAHHLSARRQDLRHLRAGGVTPGLSGVTPDAKDAGEGRSARDVVVPVVEVTREGGFDWTDAAIGGAGAAGIIAIGLGSALGLRRRPRAVV